MFKNKFRVFLAVLFSILITGNLFSQSGFEDALKKASGENKRIIVDVYTDWCGWCKKMDADAYSNKEIISIIEDNFVLVKLNAESSQKINYNGKQYTEEELSYYFDVFSFPTTVFLEPDGTLITFSYDKYPMKNVPGFVKADDFKKLLVYIRDGKYKDTDLSKIL